MKLSSFKPTLKKILIAGACLVLIVAFIPFSGGMGSLGNKSIVKVGSYNINPNVIKADVINYLRMFQMQGQNPSQRDIYSMLNYAVQNNVVKYLYVNEADKLGIQIDEEILNSAITGNPYFKDEEGNFDKERFKQIVGSQFKSEQDFKDSLKTDIALTMITSAISINMSFPEDLLKYSYEGLSQLRDIEYIAIDKESIKDVPEATEDFIKKTYESKKEEFTVPEYRDIEMLYFTVNDFNDVKASEAEVEKYYKDNSSDYKEEDLYEISQAIFNDEKEAEEMYKNLKDANFEVEEGRFTEIGSINKSVVQGVYGYNIAQQSIGSYSKPLKTDIGYHILFLKSVTEGKLIPLSEVKESIVAKISAEKRDMAIEEFKLNVQSKAKSATNLEDLAKENNKLKYTKHVNVDSKGITKEGNPVVVIGGENTLHNVFAVKENTASNVMQDGALFYITKVTKIEKSYVKNLEDVKQDIEKIWLAEQRHKQAFAIATNINQETANAKKLESANYAVKKTTAGLLNSSNVNKQMFTYSNMQSIFNLNKGENAIIDNPGSRYIIVAKLADIRSTPVNKQDYEAFKASVAEMLDQSANIAYLGYLYNNYEVKIDKEKLSEILLQQ